MQYLIIFITVVAIAQMFILYLCWQVWHEHTFKLRKRYQAHMSVDLLRIHNNVVTADGMAELLQEGHYGSLNPAQRDLVKTIRKACTQARHRLKNTMKYTGEDSEYK